MQFFDQSNDSSYEQKYLKYKQKYLALKKQIGGDCSITLRDYSVKTKQIETKKAEQTNLASAFKKVDSAISIKRADLATKKAELDTTEKKFFMSSASKANAVNPLKESVNKIQSEITALEADKQAQQTKINAVNAELNLLQTEKAYQDLKAQSASCAASEAYDKMFRDIGLSKLSFAVKSQEELEKSGDAFFGRVCRHGRDERGYHTVSNLTSASSKPHRYYIIVDEDTKDVFIYCEKCGIAQPKVLMTAMMGIPDMDTSKTIKIGIKPIDSGYAKDKRSSCYMNLKDAPLSNIVANFCAVVGDPVGELASNRSCTTYPHVLSVKFDYDFIKQLRNASSVKQNNYKPVIETLNAELAKVKELKVKSIRKLTPNEIATLK